MHTHVLCINKKNAVRMKYISMYFVAGMRMCLYNKK